MVHMLRTQISKYCGILDTHNTAKVEGFIKDNFENYHNFVHGWITQEMYACKAHTCSFT